MHGCIQDHKRSRKCMCKAARVAFKEFPAMIMHETIILCRFHVTLAMMIEVNLIYGTGKNFSPYSYVGRVNTVSKATLAQLMKINILLYIIHNIILDPD